MSLWVTDERLSCLAILHIRNTHPRRSRGSQSGREKRDNEVSKLVLENYRPAFSPIRTDCPWVSEDDKHKDVDTDGIVTQFVSLKDRRLANACHLLDSVPPNLFTEKVLQKTLEMEFLRT